MPTFAMLAHSQPELVARLVQRLAPRPVVIHLDTKADRGAFTAALRPLDNVELVPPEQSHDIGWAGFSMVRAMFVLLTRAASLTADDDHVVVCSGQDYPVKPLEDFDAHLAGAPFRQHIRYFDIDRSSDQYRRQVFRRHFRDLTLLPSGSRMSRTERVNNLARRAASAAASPIPLRRPDDLPHVAFGSTWFALTGSCLREVLTMRSDERDRFFRLTFSPDEKYFHTLVSMTRHHRDTPAGGFEPFTGNGTYRMANFHLIDPSLSKWFTDADFDRIATSGTYFVRKVRAPESSSLLDRIDRELLQLP